MDKDKIVVEDYAAKENRWEKTSGGKEDGWLWLCSVPGLYRTGKKALLDYFGTPGEIFRAEQIELEKLPFLREQQKQQLLESRKDWDQEKRMHILQEQGIRFISHESCDYPKRLHEICDYPYGLFVKGKLPSDEKPSVAVVGARLCSSYGRHMAAGIAGELAAAGVQIVSGMARGVDGTAQKAAMDAGGESFAVLGSGTDICYPRENRWIYENLTEKGGVLSEYPPGTPPLPFHFPMRNRIISGLSDLILVAEAKDKSGSLITADLALEQGRDVIAVPGRTGDVLSAGCNSLIDQGAGIFISSESLLERLNLGKTGGTELKKANITLEREENLVYSVLEFQTKNLQTIADETGLSPQEAGAVLVRLLLRGLDTEDAKNYYSKV